MLGQLLEQLLVLLEGRSATGTVGNDIVDIGRKEQIQVEQRQFAGGLPIPFGEVRRAGEYRAQQPLTILQALALAGGFTPFAGRGGVLILRRRLGKSDQTIPIDYERILSGVGTAQNIPLFSGDTVVVT